MAELGLGEALFGIRPRTRYVCFCARTQRRRPKGFEAPTRQVFVTQMRNKAYIGASEGLGKPIPRERVGVALPKPSRRPGLTPIRGFSGAGSPRVKAPLTPLVLILA